jgi:5-methyltetrahydrofolate--homocysteine methyltransferase
LDSALAAALQETVRSAFRLLKGVEMVNFEDFHSALSEGNVDRAKELTQQALDDGHSADKVLKDGLIRSMERIGTRFKNAEIFLPEVFIAARAMHAGLAVLKPILAKSSRPAAAKVVMGTVKGDLHDIGKNLVGMMLEGGGFQVVDVGIDVPSDKFIEAAKQHGAEVIGLSAMLTTTMIQMQETVKKVRAEALPVKVIVGGAPVTAQFASQIGADGYAADAASAVEKVKELLSIQ